MKKTILCYGDSNTWGYIPGTGARYSEDVRWTGVLAKELGPSYRVIEDGISGRSTVWDDPFDPCRNGLDGLGYSIQRSKPLDWMILMLGSNDLNYTDAYGYYKGLKRLIRRIMSADSLYTDTEPAFRDGPKLLLISPIRLHPEVSTRRPEIHVAHSYEDSCQFACYTERLAQEWNIPWLDASEIAKPSETDCLHMDIEDHYKLGVGIAKKLISLC